MFLLTNFALFQIRQYIIERDFYFEYSEAYTAERLIQQAIVDVEKIIEDNKEKIDLSGLLYYDKGEVAYWIKSDIGNSFSIELISKTKNNRVRQFNYMSGECGK